MTEKEAIRWLRLALVESEKVEEETEVSDIYKEMCRVAIKALEKQIPKKPDYEADGYADGQLVYDTWVCPNCETRYEVDYDDYEYCPECGQAIDWGEDE